MLANLPSDLSTDVPAWRAAFAMLPLIPPPCRHLSPATWMAMHDAGLDFLDRFGVVAAQLGWTARQLFGVHPEHGTLRFEFCGALIVSGQKVVGVDATCVRFERTAAYRNTPGKPEGVPIWTFAASRKGK